MQSSLNSFQIFLPTSQALHLTTLSQMSIYSSFDLTNHGIKISLCIYASLSIIINTFVNRLLDASSMITFFIIQGRGVNIILHQILTHEEAKRALKNYHNSACDGNLSRVATMQKNIQKGHFSPTLSHLCPCCKEM